MSYTHSNRSDSRLDYLEAGYVISARTSEVELHHKNLLHNLRAYYDFDGSNWENDKVGKYNLQLHSNTISIAQQTSNGLIKSAVSMSGDSETLRAENALYNFDSSDFTIAFWYYPFSSPVDVVFGEDNGRSTFLVRHLDTNRLLVSINDHNDAVTKITSTSFLSLDTWHFIAIVREKDHLKLMINNETEKGAKLPAPDSRYITDSTHNYVGSGDLNESETFPYDGRIDEFGVWTRALKEDEIDFIYNEGDGYHQYIFGMWWNFPAKQDVNMETHKITNLQNAQTDDEAINKGQGNSFYIRRDGSNFMDNDLNMASNKITNVLNPTSAQDAVTINYANNNYEPLGSKPTFQHISYVMSGTMSANSFSTREAYTDNNLPTDTYIWHIDIAVEVDTIATSDVIRHQFQLRDSGVAMINNTIRELNENMGLRVVDATLRADYTSNKSYYYYTFTLFNEVADGEFFFRHSLANESGSDVTYSINARIYAQPINRNTHTVTTL